MLSTEELKKAHEEELEDVEKYRSMAKNARSDYAAILLDIADEEEKHAKYIKAIIDDMGEKEKKEEAAEE